MPSAGPGDEGHRTEEAKAAFAVKTCAQPLPELGDRAGFGAVLNATSRNDGVSTGGEVALEAKSTVAPPAGLPAASAAGSPAARRSGSPNAPDRAAGGLGTIVAR